MAVPVNASIVEHCQTLEDPRMARTKQHTLLDSLGLSIRKRILLANPEISLYCPTIRFLVDQNKINNRTCMAGVYVRSDVGSEACFLPICYNNYFCSIKYVKVTPFSMACWVEGTRKPPPHVRRRPRLAGPRWQ